MLERDLTVDVEGLGKVTAILLTEGLLRFLSTRLRSLADPSGPLRGIIDIGMRIKSAVMAQYTIAHPRGDPALNFLYGTILVERLAGRSTAATHAFSGREVDRSPTVRA